MTKLNACRKMGSRRFTLSSKISGPARLPRYTGIRGKMQGDRKDNNPYPKATKIDICITSPAYQFTWRTSMSRVDKLTEMGLNFFIANAGLSGFLNTRKAPLRLLTCS
jgi:hypothetical protein